MLRKVKYNALSFFAFIIGFIGVFGIKVIIIMTAIGIGMLTDKYIGYWGHVIGFWIGVAVAGVLFFLIEKSEVFEKLDDYISSFNTFPYTEKYGKNYPQPKPEDFGISKVDFTNYNNRFQLDYIAIILTYGPALIALFFVLTERIKGAVGYSILATAALSCIILHYLFKFFNKKLSMRHRLYKKISKYQESLTIYHKVRDESSRI